MALMPMLSGTHSMPVLLVLMISVNDVSDHTIKFTITS